MPSIQYRMISGVAIPRDLYTLGSFQGLQAAINQWLVGGYGTPIGVDGEIGSATLAAARNVIAYINEGGGGSIPVPSSVPALAERARTYADEILRPQDHAPNFRPDPSARYAGLPYTWSADSTTSPAPPAPPSSKPGSVWPILVIGVLGIGAYAFTRK